MADQWILPIIVGVLVGIVLLVLEYRTKWFARSLRYSEEDKGKGSPSISEDFWETKILGAQVNLMTMEGSPTDNWLQVAEKVKKLIESVTSEERDGPITLISIESEENQAIISFEFPDVFGEWYKIEVVVNNEGKIVKYQRKFIT